LKEFFFRSLVYRNQNVAFIVHSSKLEVYLPNSKFIFDVLYKRAKGFICVSNEIKKLIQTKYKIDNVYTINNAVDLSKNEVVSKDNMDLDFDYILYYGRLEDDVKNISLLLDSYKISKLRSNGVRLLILGDGTDKGKLMDKVNQLNLYDDVKFVSFTSNPFPYIKNSRFVALTSRYEGFPMVIPEALSVGIPVISVDCQSGPKEIIKNGYNGLLVENFNAQALAEAMNSFIFDEDLYQACKRNAQKSVEKFSIENISKEWDKLVNMLI
jgi:glycosyltransferase involved in cell wall biosynthesis